jgi:predicted aspartyl protease
VSIPGLANGRPVQLEVDTGSIMSSVDEEFAREAGLKLKFSNIRMMFQNNIPVTQSVELDSLALGGATARDVRFMIDPPGFMGPDLTGMLGEEFFRNYDVELDFVSGKFNLFAPNTCSVAPVYWTKEAFAQIPMKLVGAHIVAEALLDGVRVDVVIDTGESRSTMSLDAAKELFGWSGDNPNLKKVRDRRINGGASVPLYHYPFANLSFEGIQVINPDFDIIPARNYGERASPIILGVNVLRQLHLYIAYKDKVLYLTTAEAH